MPRGSTEGTMPAGKSFSGFQKLCTPAPKRVMPIFGAGFMAAEARQDHLVINFRAVVAAVFGNLEQERRHRFDVRAG